MRDLRNFVLRLSINYIALYALLALRGVTREQQLFGVWVVAFIFTLLSATVRRILLIVTLPIIIMTGGLFIFFVDGLILLLTAALTRLNVANFWWALLGVFVMSNANIWVERAFRAIGWIRDDAASATENVMTRHSPRWWLQLILLGILLFGIGFSAAMGVQLFLLVSKVTRRLWVMKAAADIGFVLLTFGIAWLVAEGLALDRRARFSVMVTALAVFVVALPTSVLIFASEPLEANLPPIPRPETSYWQLPSGSLIAYTYVPARGGGSSRNPIIYLHGGPGWGVLDEDITFFQQFGEAGFDVYLYDQIGCGKSERLPDIAAYTIDRHVRDLEEIREVIRADRLIIIAHEAGAEIAARYMIKHRDRVETVIFYSPTPLWSDRRYFNEPIRTVALPGPIDLFQPSIVRPLVALAVAYYSPRTAQAYVPQEEVLAWAPDLVDASGMLCTGSEISALTPEFPGYNPYVEVVGRRTANLPPDPRPELQDVLVPTLLLRGECDPVDAAVVNQYREALPYLQAYNLEDAGSMLHLSQPTRVKKIILDFLSQGVRL